MTSPQPPGSGSQILPETEISIGVVGCGYWGPNLIRNLDALSNARVRAICDLNDERLRHVSTLYPEALALSDFEEMLATVELNKIVNHWRLASQKKNFGR